MIMGERVRGFPGGYATVVPRLPGISNDAPGRTAPSRYTTCCVARSHRSSLKGSLVDVERLKNSICLVVFSPTTTTTTKKKKSSIFGDIWRSDDLQKLTLTAFMAPKTWKCTEFTADFRWFFFQKESWDGLRLLEGQPPQDVKKKHQKKGDL